MKKKEKRDLESQLRTPIYDRETHTRPRDFFVAFSSGFTHKAHGRAQGIHLNLRSPPFEDRHTLDRNDPTVCFPASREYADR